MSGFDLFAIPEHLRPVLATDDGHDIPNAAAAHGAELDREAGEGMRPFPEPEGAGETEGQRLAAADLDAAIGDARARGASVAAGYAITFTPHDPLDDLPRIP